jgi:hypothetical protein
VNEYEKFVQWFIEQNGTRPTWRETERAIDDLERIAERKLLKAKHGGLSNRAYERALDNVDRLEMRATALRSTRPDAITPCDCGRCDCEAACAPLEEQCRDCLAGIHYHHDPDNRDLSPGKPFIGPVFGT